MKKIVGIKFRRTPKVYSFEAGELQYVLGGGVIVETAKGIEYGTVAKLPFTAEESTAPGELKPVLRLATEEDEQKIQDYEAKYSDTMRRVCELVEQSGLAMKVVDAEYTFDGQKLVIHFTADNRIDFRELVRKLASAFRLRIELRQIGGRDEVRMLGGLGSCGRVCCCNSCMDDYAHSSIKMAKNQGLSLNPTKISGLCGRLMCCLEYENKTYTEINKRMPKMGATVKTADGKEGVVVGIMQLKERVKLKIPERESFIFTDYPLTELVFSKAANGQSQSGKNETVELESDDDSGTDEDE